MILDGCNNTLYNTIKFSSAVNIGNSTTNDLFIFCLSKYKDIFDFRSRRRVKN